MIKPHYQDRHTTIYCGDVFDVLPQLPDASVHCCVTSPPYWGLRDYGVDAQLGLESTPEEYVSRMVAVFREARRVLRDDGTLWLNLGDSYGGGGGGASPKSTLTGGGGRYREGSKAKQMHEEGTIRQLSTNLKPKDLVGIPWRVAFALQSDGWYLRQDIIWHKPNPMPESVTDRCTKAHEYIFLLSKSARYWYDRDAIVEPSIEPPRAREKNNGESAVDTKLRGHDCNCGNDGTRNRRSVWTVATAPYSDAHFAVFPPKLITPCILAGCPKNGTVLDPFGGSGTTAQVANDLGRDAVLVELNPDYIEMDAARLRGNKLSFDLQYTEDL